MSDIKITYEEQLKRWAAGESVHRDEGCTPDFSCCKPKLLADPEIRKAFIAGSEAERTRFLASFLNAALAEMAKHKDVRVNVTFYGRDPGEPQ